MATCVTDAAHRGPASAGSSDHAELLGKVDVFAGLGRVALAKLAVGLEPVQLAAGEVACPAGARGNGLYLVASGAFGVYASNENGHESLIETLTPGMYFGDAETLTGASRATEVRAVQRGELLRLDEKRFRDALRIDQKIGVTVTSTLHRRLESATGDLLSAEAAIRRAVQLRLETLPFHVQRWILRASTLRWPSAQQLAVLAGDAAPAVVAELRVLGVECDPVDESDDGAIVLKVLRQLHLQEAGQQGVVEWQRTGARALGAASLWPEAIELAAASGHHQDLVELLASALRANCGGATGLPEWAEPWIARLSDAEVSQDAALCAARAAWHQLRGDAASANRLLRLAPVPVAEVDVVALAAARDRLAEPMALYPLPIGLGPSGASLRGSVVQRAQAIRARLRKKPVETVGLGVVVALFGAAIAFHSSPPHAFVLLLGASVALNVTRTVPEFASYLGLSVAWILFGIATPQQAMAGYGSTGWMSGVAMLAIGQAVSTSGLLFRSGLWVVRRLPRGVFAQGATFMLAGMLLIPMLPSSTQRGGFAMAFALAAAQAQRLKERGPIAAFIAMATFIGSNPMLFLFLNGSTLTLLAYGLMPEEARAQFDLVEWFVAAAPLALFVALGSLVALWIYLRPERQAPPLDARTVELQLSLLGRPTGREMKMGLILALTIVGWSVAPMLGVHKLVVNIAGLMAATLTGCFREDEVLGLPWHFLVGFGVVLDIPRLTASLGINDAAAGALQATFGEMRLHPLVFLFAVAILNLVVRQVLADIPALMLLGMALIPIASVMGLSPFLVALALLSTSTVWFLPSTSYTFVVASQAAEGELFSDRQAQVTSVIHTVITLAGLAVCAPLWWWMGLL